MAICFAAMRREHDGQVRPEEGKKMCRKVTAEQDFKRYERTVTKTERFQRQYCSGKSLKCSHKIKA